MRISPGQPAGSQLCEIHEIHEYVSDLRIVSLEAFEKFGLASIIVLFSTMSAESSKGLLSLQVFLGKPSNPQAIEIEFVLLCSQILN